MSPNPYIGVTGFMSRDEVVECLLSVPQSAYDPAGRKFMVGVHASAKTIMGERNSLPLKFNWRERLAETFSYDRRAFNCMHFSIGSSGTQHNLYDLLMLCLEYGGDLLHGIQLNLVWPDPQALKRIKNQRPDLKFVLQVSPHLKGIAEYNPRDLAEILLKRYKTCVDYFLVDFSRGLGQELDDAKVYQYLIELFLEIEKHEAEIGLGAGGGLHAGNVEELIGALLNDFPGLSWDAEGKLRDDQPGGGNLIIPKAQNFLTESFGLAECLDHF